MAARLTLQDVCDAQLANLENPNLPDRKDPARPDAPYALGPGGSVHQLLMAYNARLSVLEKRTRVAAVHDA